MSLIRLTKNSLRDQQKKLQQLERYLPTLQLKKGLLQTEVVASKIAIEEKQQELEKLFKKLSQFSSFFSEEVHYNLPALMQVEHVHKRYENIAGVEVPVFESVSFVKENYFLFDTPAWLNSALASAKEGASLREHVAVLEEKKRNLEKELREVSIRVNLFEKVLIPRCRGFVRKIHVFLGDQELAAVARSKVAKEKKKKQQEEQLWEES